MGKGVIQTFPPTHPPYRFSSRFLYCLFNPRDGPRAESVLSAELIPGEPPPASGQGGSYNPIRTHIELSTAA